MAVGPDDPRRATATHEEMVIARRALALHKKAITDYTFCIAKELDAIVKAGCTLKPQQEADVQRVRTQKHDAAVDQPQAITASTSR